VAKRVLKKVGHEPMAARAPAGGQEETRRFVRFLLVGLLNTAVGYSIFAALTLSGLGIVPATLGATVMGALFNFKSIGSLVFGSTRAKLLPRFLAVYVLQCGANIGALSVFQAAGVSLLIAEAIILPVLAVAGFLLMRHWVFHPDAPDTLAQPSQRIGIRK
jgi:putative flippase GtrA